MLGDRKKHGFNEEFSSLIQMPSLILIITDPPRAEWTKKWWQMLLRPLQAPEELFLRCPCNPLRSKRMWALLAEKI